MTLQSTPILYLVFASLHVLIGHIGAALVYFARFGTSPLVLYRVRNSAHSSATRAVSLLSGLWALTLVLSAFWPAFVRTRLGAAIGVIPASVSFGLATGGLLLMALSQVSMGKAFRVGQDETERATQIQTTGLQTAGLHAWSRNPIYVGSWVALVGMTLFHPSALLVLLVALIGGGIHRLVRAEEAFLRQSFGELYSDYCRKTPRYCGIRAL